jgi:hypothetical protein
MNAFHPKIKLSSSIVYPIILLFRLDLFYPQYLRNTFEDVYKEALVAENKIHIKTRNKIHFLFLTVPR